ncbi:MAG: hypothetical protein MPJ08_08630 [Nitrosopumilus sp.]|nr:hypothetical protein [Nitrosopumilus sp.]
MMGRVGPGGIPAEPDKASGLPTYEYMAWMVEILAIEAARRRAAGADPGRAKRAISRVRRLCRILHADAPPIPSPSGNVDVRGLGRALHDAFFVLHDVEYDTDYWGFYPSAMPGEYRSTDDAIYLDNENTDAMNRVRAACFAHIWDQQEMGLIREPCLGSLKEVPAA